MPLSPRWSLGAPIRGFYQSLVRAALVEARYFEAGRTTMRRRRTGFQEGDRIPSGGQFPIFFWFPLKKGKVGSPFFWLPSNTPSQSGTAILGGHWQYDWWYRSVGEDFAGSNKNPQSMWQPTFSSCPLKGNGWDCSGGFWANSSTQCGEALSELDPLVSASAWWWGARHVFFFFPAERRGQMLRQDVNRLLGGLGLVRMTF